MELRFAEFWRVPEGPAGAMTCAAAEYRARVIAAAKRWCDNATETVDELVACGVCIPCEARAMLVAGIA